MKQSLSVLVVEDEIIIGEALKLYLDERGHTPIELLLSYEETIEFLKVSEVMPEIVLLDVRLYGEKSGIDVAKYLNEFHPDIPYIFLTSQYDRRIVENALATNPGGYLAKPIQKETLWTTLELAYHNRFQNQEENKNSTLTVSDGSNTHIIKQSDILYILADHVYVKIFSLRNNMILARTSLQSVLKVLSTDHFMQCHRSAIVNLSHVDTYDQRHLRIDGHKIPVSRAKKKDVIEKIKNFSH